MSVAKLNKSCRQFLLTRQQKPSRDTEFVCKPGKVITQLLDWAKFVDVTLGREAGNNFILTRAGIAATELWLSENNQAPLATVYQEKDRQQTTMFDSDEKQASIKPKDPLALMAVTDSRLLVNIQPYYVDSSEPLSQINLEVIVATFDLSRFDRLVVIENRDSFNDWYRYSSKVKLTNPLVIYRGDGGDATACKALRIRWLQEKAHCPMIYFGDLDLAGLNIAIGGQYQQVLLPSFDWLSSHLVNEHYPDKQRHLERIIKSRCPGNWKLLFDLIHDHKAGLRQQWMFGPPLVLY